MGDHVVCDMLDTSLHQLALSFMNKSNNNYIIMSIVGFGGQLHTTMHELLRLHMAENE